MVIDYIMPIFVNVVYCVSRQARLFYLGNLYISMFVNLLSYLLLKVHHVLYVY
jgi:hypothetical protein